MNPFTVFFPFLLFPAGAALLALAASPLVVIAGGVLAICLFTDWSSKNRTVEYRRVWGLSRSRWTDLLTAAGFLLLLAFYALLFFHFSTRWLRADPSPDWQQRAMSADTAIVLGFGIEEDRRSGPAAGPANRFLLDWTLKNTAATTLLVQEGVWLAAQETPPAGRRLIRIHPHDPARYRNTLDAANLALEKLAALGRSRAVLVAHDLQLQRAAWDFEKVRRARPEWAGTEIIVPDVPPTPFPAHSSQWHTRGRLRYQFAELFLSRPRDYLAAAPAKR